MNVRDKVEVQKIDEAIDELEDIQNELAGIAQRMRTVAERIKDKHAIRYMVADLEIMVEAGGWLSHDPTIPGWIQDLKEQRCELTNSEKGE